jgi:hypothetical protein
MSATDVNPNGTETEMSAPDETPRALKARLVSVTLQLEIVADDGDMLHPLNLAPVKVRSAEWPTFTLEAQLADVQRQLDQGASLPR